MGHTSVSNDDIPAPLWPSDIMMRSVIQVLVNTAKRAVAKEDHNTSTLLPDTDLPYSFAVSANSAAMSLISASMIASASFGF